MTVNGSYLEHDLVKTGVQIWNGQINVYTKCCGLANAVSWQADSHNFANQGKRLIDRPDPQVGHGNFVGENKAQEGWSLIYYCLMVRYSRSYSHMGNALV